MAIKPEADSLWCKSALVMECRFCGEQLPVDLGSSLDCCEDWLRSTINRLPLPHQFPFLLQASVILRLCSLAFRERTVNAMLTETLPESIRATVARPASTSV
jgi:hypothetical protein